ncbi:type II secretion system F family protein [Gilliamella sp. ESL0250]|uniref:type II secretion system F family protein n=1 Tax=Gilliamella sp. ESL0250 TaxID=2705036 RepID=UPI0015804923|nr:type II secretion system F family protein [Gilliamella sp. ESL0250]NUF48514.1 type II secretion system F family protein [Gilliamella sp. ESL0250]
MISLLNIIIPIILIYIGSRELINSYLLYQRKEKLSLLLNSENKEKKITKKHINQKNVAFEKIAAKNSVSLSFLRRFQEQNSWKIYAVVIGFSFFYLVNQIFSLVIIDSNILLIVLVFIIIVVIIVPDRLLKIQTAKKIRRISRDLPLIIDMMAIMVKSGMTVENGFRYLSTRVKPINRDVAAILERACLMMDVNGIELSIDLIQREVPCKEIRMFCVTLKRSISYGNSIYEALLELSSEIREIQKLTIEEKIAAIAAKMTLPMMGFFLAPVLVIITGPIVMNIISTLSNR